ncbi:membrane protein [Enterococcus thailandicus]|uniref:Membrane protein n=3 Tax=root TaxID=1 RepID=A0A1L8XSL8_ENTTH|nr:MULTISPECIES: DUF2871 domain-containing protein [Enterococcus]MDG3374588.1 DUF2871 domain-containing protein [Vibrio parahaemolyticus]ASZ07903.1 DUF2871 domain-containing protein [Enterococcus thailandicus]MDK4351815.1 DUF2871 domain-containing protein [Enterococcus thailandicus]MDT2734252.1 DUF2871 domain-containing protein [Enterococcus thailandicus]MDT2752857.1 DUF2871 domain-containing protein [Enterococcus thailandicus]
MKKVMNTAIVYFVLAMISGVFYREATKLNDFTGQTVLAVVHTHLFALGTGLFLLIAVLFKVTRLEENKRYKKFYILYNLSFPLMIVMMVVRGLIQIQQQTISTGVDAMISGIAGLSHIGVTVALLMVLLAIKKEMLNEM